MSGMLSGEVWKSNLLGELKPLAAALADGANDAGGSLYPSIAYLAWKIGRSERTVQYGMEKLKELGVVEVLKNGNGGRGKTPRYQFCADKLPKRDAWRASVEGDPDQVLERVQSTPEESERVQSTTERVQPVAPETSEETSVPQKSETSVNREREGEKKKSKKKPSVTEKYRDIKLQPERNLIPWMRDAAAGAGKHWCHDGKKGNRGPTWQMKDELKEKEKTFGLVRRWWIDFLIDNVGDEERYPYAMFLNSYYPKRLEQLTDEQSIREMQKEDKPDPTLAFLEDGPKLSDLD